MACTVRVDGNRADVWAGTQDPLNARSTAAGALDFDTDQVHLRTWCSAHPDRL